MKKSTRFPFAGNAQPLWLRSVAIFCVFLISLVSSAQAAHVHSGWNIHTTASVHSPNVVPASEGGEEHCQLCQAMHSALPSSGEGVPALFPIVSLAQPEPAVRAGNSQLLLAMFSRPPPVRD